MRLIRSKILLHPLRYYRWTIYNLVVSCDTGRILDNTSWRNRCAIPVTANDQPWVLSNNDFLPFLSHAQFITWANMKPQFYTALTIPFNFNSSNNNWIKLKKKLDQTFLEIKIFEIEQLHAIALLSLVFDRQREIHSGSYVNLATYKPQTPYMNSYWLRAFVNYYSRMHTCSLDFHRSWGSKAKKLETSPWNGTSVQEQKQRIMIDLKAIIKWNKSVWILIPRMYR